MSKDEQREALRSFDDFFVENGILFAYPVHGGFMGYGAKILSFGTSTKYDAFAPEFDTYETIKELALRRVIAGQMAVTPNAIILLNKRELPMN